MLRWIARSSARHSCKIVALVDAQTVIGALAKGRTSSPSLRQEVRRVAALVLSADLFVKYIYVPSEDNPADAPSRGVRRVRRHREPGARPRVRKEVIKQQRQYRLELRDAARRRQFLFHIDSRWAACQAQKLHESEVISI